MTAAWIHANQRAIAGLGEITDFLAAHAVTVPAATRGLARVVIDTDSPDDVATFATRHHIGASVDCDGRIYADLHFAAAVLRIQAEGGVS
jgi:hypothetical protein